MLLAVKLPAVKLAQDLKNKIYISTRSVGKKHPDLKLKSRASNGNTTVNPWGYAFYSLATNMNV